jgi:ABC-type Mn2+/Zn2+ transport system permease subunit
METTVHRHHPPAPAPTGYTTLRLGAVVSLVAAVVAVVLSALVDVPEAVLVVAVMIVAFGLSWHVTWRDELTRS